MRLTGDFRKIRERHEDDTAVELWLSERVERARHTLNAAVMEDGEVSPAEQQAIDAIDTVAALTAHSLRLNREINGMYGAVGADLPVDSADAQARWRALATVDDPLGLVA